MAAREPPAHAGQGGQSGDKHDDAKADAQAGQRQVTHLGHMADVHTVHDVVKSIDYLRRDSGHGQPEQQGPHRVPAQIINALGQDALPPCFHMKCEMMRHSV